MLIYSTRTDFCKQALRYELHKRPGQDLVVFLPGLRRVGSTRVNYYSRITWSPLFSASCLYVSDPCLDDSRPELRGSWFQGCEELFAVEQLANDIRTMSSDFNFSEGRTVLYGSSQGGFAALALGAYLTAAKVLAECPQSDVRLFNLKTDTSRAAKFCYGVDSISAVPKAFDNRLNLMTLYKSRDFTPRSRILVKQTDTHAVDFHVKPLKDAFSNRTDVHVFDGALGEGGHSALPKEIIVDEINALLA